MTNISGRERPIASSLLSYIKAIDCLLAAVNLKGSSQAEGSSNSEMVCTCVAESAASFEGITLNDEILSPARDYFCWLCERQAGACPWRGGCVTTHL